MPKKIGPLLLIIFGFAGVALFGNNQVGAQEPTPIATMVIVNTDGMKVEYDQASGEIVNAWYHVDSCGDCATATNPDYPCASADGWCWLEPRPGWYCNGDPSLPSTKCWRLELSGADTGCYGYGSWCCWPMVRCPW